MNMSVILVMAVLIEAIITYVKTWMVDRRVQWQMIVSVVLSIVICIAYGLDIPAAVGISSPLPFVGRIITGILVSRGSNYINDLLGRLSGTKGARSTAGTAGTAEIYGSDGSDGAVI